MAAIAKELSELTDVLVRYDRGSDTFIVRLSAVSGWVADDVNGEYFVLRNPETGDVVGFLVEDFRRVFLKRHPDIAKTWNEAHAPWRLRSAGRKQDVNRELVELLASEASSQLAMGLPRR
jgi:hypothetical protein